MWPERVRRVSPLATSQIRNVLSSEADTIQVPSGATAHPQHGRRCGPTGCDASRRVATSQIRNVLSSEADTIQVPSGATAHPWTPARCGPTGCGASRRWPHPRSATSCRRRRTRSRCHPAPPHTHGPQSVWPYRVRASLAAGDIPDPQRLVVGGGHDPGAIRRHRTRVNRPTTTRCDRAGCRREVPASLVRSSRGRASASR